MHTESLRGYHNTSLFPGPQSYLMFASWEPEGGDEFPLLPVGIGSDWGLAPGPYLILWPFLVCWSVPPMSPVRAWPSGESERLCKREPKIPSGGAPPCLSLHSIPLEVASFTPARPSHQSGSWCGWNLTGASRNVAETSNQETKHHTQRAGEFRFITSAGPEELTLQALLLLLSHFSRVRLCATPQTAAH